MYKFPVDKVIILNLVENPERRAWMEYQLDYLGIDKSNVEWHITVKFPHGEEIKNAINEYFIKYHGLQRGIYTQPAEYSVMREHYSIIKKEYLMGANSILVFEDDLCFVKNIEMIKNHFDNIPENAMILQAAGWIGYPEYDDFFDNNENNKNLLWNLHINLPFWGMDFYYLDRNGMNFILSYMEARPTLADMPIYFAATNHYTLYNNTYVSHYPLAIQYMPVFNSEIQGNGEQKWKDNRRKYKINFDDYISYDEFKKQYESK